MKQKLMPPRPAAPTLLTLLTLLAATTGFHLPPQKAALIPSKPGASYFTGFDPKPAPRPAGLVLRKGDRLAICGDSITEQKMYSRIMETYLTICVPQLEVTTRQYGWSGEQAPGFLARMTNDCLRFHPTIATTCYGMNDHGYRRYEEQIGAKYRTFSTAIIEAFKENGVRPIQGSPGCVGKMPFWVKSADGTVRDLNLNLCNLRNIGIEIAEQEHVGFADVFWPMFTAGFEAQKRYGTNYAIAGQDGVHPGWAGHVIMAYAFLKSFGLDGEIGTFTVDLRSDTAQLSAGHELISCKGGEVQIRSRRYPFCATGKTNRDDSIRSAMTLVSFNRELNRLTLKLKNPKAGNYRVTWGNGSKTYTARQLAKGVNLAEDFEVNPFSKAFAEVDKAVAFKQSYETKQIKTVFHDLGQYKSVDAIKDEEVKYLYGLRNEDGKWDKDQLAAETEKTRAPLVQALKDSFVPVTHTLKIEVQYGL